MIENGIDFFELKGKYDWIIGNPPFHISYKFFDKASDIAIKGFAFLINIQAMNSLLPSRLESYKEKGFYLSKIHIVQDKRWFGRYYFIIFDKLCNSNLLS